MMKERRLLRVLGQAFAWAGVWLLVFVVLGGGSPGPLRFVGRLLPVLLGIALVVFVNGAILLPRLYFRADVGRGVGYSVSSRRWYVVAALTTVIGVALLLQYGWNPDRRFPVEFGRGVRPYGLGTATLRYLLPLATSLLGATLLEVIGHASAQERRVIHAEREQLTTELKFLKSQINPHFLFNSLNNIYTLTLLKDDQAPESLLKLAGMLRYMLYEAESPTVALSREIDYIRNFVALYQLKDSRGLNVTTALDESRPELPIAPLLLIPFVENAFKHSRIEDRRDGYIDIRLDTTATQIHFTVVNSIPPIATPVDRVGGIGLDNVRKRLQLIYPDRHELTTGQGGGAYSVTLQIQLL